MTAILTHKLSVYSDGSIQSPSRILYRVNHDTTDWRGGDQSFGLPEVFRLDPDHHVVLTWSVQWLWRRINSHLTDDQFSSLMSNNLAFTNGTGVPGRNNYISGDIGYDKDPAFDQARVCGGAILTGRESGSNLIINTLDTRQPFPTAEEVIARGLYYEAVNIDWTSSGAVIRPLKGAWGKPVYMPLISSVQASFPLTGLTKITGTIPSPYQYP